MLKAAHSTLGEDPEHAVVINTEALNFLSKYSSPDIVQEFLSRTDPYTCTRDLS